MIEEEEPPPTHPDGFSVDVTPECDWFKANGYEISDVTLGFERRARRAEARVAQLERELAYMRARNAEQATGQFGVLARKHADETIAERAAMQKTYEEERQ